MPQRWRVDLARHICAKIDPLESCECPESRNCSIDIERRLKRNEVAGLEIAVLEDWIFKKHSG